MTALQKMATAGEPERRDAMRDLAARETTLPAAFAAGDMRNGSIKGVALAVGEGASVVRLICEYLPTAQLEREPAASVTW